MVDARQLLRELIALPSVNPAFLPALHPCAGEQRVAEFLASAGARAGLDVEMREVATGRPNVLLRLAPAGPIRRRILLLAHTDTVGVEPFSERIFDPVATPGKIHGRGACDTKGCVAAMVAALAGLAERGPRPAHTEIIFAGVIDEENGQHGSRALAAEGFRADLAVVGEPTRLHVVTAHKGNLWLRVNTRGTAAHGSRPELGRNAIRLMARIVELLEGEYAQSLACRRRPLLRAPTVNVGAIQGGVQANIVPAHCEILLDRRTLPGETRASVLRELKGLLRDHGLQATFTDIKDAACHPLETDPENPLVRQFLRATRCPGPCGVDYYCDASVLAHAGTPSLVFGPGDIAQAHTADEWISERSLEAGVRALARFLDTLA